MGLSSQRLDFKGLAGDNSVFNNRVVPQICRRSTPNETGSGAVDQNWFEMPEVRRRKLANAVWIPLRAIHRIEEIGNHGHAGYRSEFFGVGTLAVPTEKRVYWFSVTLSLAVLELAS